MKISIYKALINKKVSLLFLFFCLVHYSNSQTFTDVTSSSGIVDLIDTVSDPIIARVYGGGASVVDFDKDGDLDFFVGTNFGKPSQLYRNNGNGQFQEVASTLGITNSNRVRVGLWFDYDGDELLDLVLVGDCFKVSSGCVDKVDIFLYKQTESGMFTEINNSGLDFNGKYNGVTLRERVVGGIASADINNDGWLDVLVTVWGAEATLFINNGNGTFSDISISSDLGQESMFRWQPVFHDFNRDGYIDVYINVDFDANELWSNNGDNTFTNIAASVGADSSFNEMGMTLGDYDNDGDLDIYSTNISRVEDGEVNLRHNILLRNDWANNSLSFTEVSNEPAINVGASGWDWGTTFFDANNDGYIDLATTNGWPQEEWSPDESKLWLNVDGILFSDISESASFNDLWEAASLLAFDMDRDGDLDLLQSMKLNTGDAKGARLYQNNYSAGVNPNNYLVVRPRLDGSNHFAIGAKVTATFNGISNIRLITAGTSHFGQEPAEAFFGIGTSNLVDEIKIEWPDNTETIVTDINANQVITISKSGILSIDEKSLIDKMSVYPNPVKDILNIETNIELKEIEIFNVLGQKVLMDFNNKKINVSSLISGTYFIKINDVADSITKTIRFIKR
ncbi:FG-GAP-like repeat-containing protein [Winogradskyella haliclonae]|nr:FG-GAP-like repeat-containing protein [Winogradskyella haliclonae]